MTEIRSVGVALIRTDRRTDRETDMTKLINAFRDSANAPEKRFNDVRNH